MPLLSGIAYTLTAARTVQGGDSGELAAVGASGGIAHPPGYPLFVLWSRFFAWLPALSPTHRVALATAIAGAVAIDALRRACRAWGASEIASDLAAAAFAVSPLAWRLSSEPEVFVLNAAIVLTIVRLAAPAAWASEARRAVWLALFAGLALANHHTAVLVAPIGLFAFVRALLAGDRRGRTALASLVAFAVGLLPYGYLLVTTSACRWNDIDSVGDLAHHFLRADYGTTQLAASVTPPEPVAQLRLLGASFLDAGIALSLALGVVAIAARRRSWSWLALLLTIALAGPVFVMRFNLPPRGLQQHVVERFHLLPLALASVAGAAGIDELATFLRSRTGRAAALAAALLFLAARAFSSETAVIALHRPTTERYVRNVLAFLPENSVLVAEGDDLVGGLEYMQCALGARPDVVVVVPSLMLSARYARRVSATMGMELVHGVVPPGGDRPVLSGVDLLEQLVATRRSIFLTTWYTKNLDQHFPSYPIGPLIRVPMSVAEIPGPEELLAENEQVYGAMTLDDAPPDPGTWAAVRYETYARPWNVLASAFASTDAALAAECRQRARAFVPVGTVGF